MSDLKERIARHHRKYRDEKMAYVDARKMRIGACEECGRAPREGATHCFEFAHRDAATKEDSVARLCNSRVSFESSLARLDSEMDRCRLLCGACKRPACPAMLGGVPPRTSTRPALRTMGARQQGPPPPARTRRGDCC